MQAPTKEERKRLAWKRINTLIKLVGKHGKRCWYCQEPFKSFKEIEIDHIVPRVRGGSNKLSNLAIACKPCNRAKWGLPLNEFLRWLRKPKKPLPHIHELGKIPEEQFSFYGDKIEKGLRVPTKNL